MIYIKEQRPAYKMPGESSFFISFDFDRRIVDTIKNLSNYQYHKTKQVWEIPVTCLSRCIDLLNNLDDIRLDLCADSSETDFEEIILDNKNYLTKPYDYQEDGIKYGLTHDKWLLLDAPGLGKTLQMILLAQELKERENITHCLIVCGINTLKYNWKSEIEKHSNLTCKILGEKINSKGNSVIGSVKDRLDDLKNGISEFFIITNIETLRDKEIIKELQKQQNNIEMIVADELHKMKSPSSQQGKNFLKLKAKYKIGLTGTLLLNNPLDAYVPLKWLGIENSTYTNFKYYFCEFSGPFNNILSGYKNIPILKDEIENNSLRRTKDLLIEKYNLPEKLPVINEFVEMDSEQRTFYNNVVNGITTQVDKVELDTSTILSMCIRLRQATALPSILTTENIASAKVNRCIELAKEIIDNDEKVVIFSNFKKPLEPVFNELRIYNPLICTGDNTDFEIKDAIDKFQNDNKYKVMCCSISKMGTGITLNAASYAIFMDSSWTAADNQQAEDRIHRIGSKKPVTIYYLWTKDTIDERVKEIVEDKEAISDFIIDDKLSSSSIESLKKYILDL